MSGPRLEIDLDKIRHNALTLRHRLDALGISVTAVTKATLGSPEIAKVLIEAGVSGLGDARVENIIAMQCAKIAAPMTLIRTPMMSQVEQVVRHADVSFNTELDIIAKLSSAATKAGHSHRVVLMVELGDLREGIMPSSLEKTVREVLRFPNIDFEGIGTNLACRSGTSPDTKNMAELSALADSIDATFGPIVKTVSGGNSANLPWALSGTNTGRINNLRLGEAILLGREPLHRQPLKGLHTNAITLVAEVIESNRKPSTPWGEMGQTAFGKVTSCPSQTSKGLSTSQAILAIGVQDTDPAGLEPPIGIKILAASSDHLVVSTATNHTPLRPGSELRFAPNYSALLRAMTSPFITKVTSARKPRPNVGPLLSAPA